MVGYLIGGAEPLVKSPWLPRIGPWLSRWGPWLPRWGNLVPRLGPRVVRVVEMVRLVEVIRVVEVVYRHEENLGVLLPVLNGKCPS